MNPFASTYYTARVYFEIIRPGLPWKVWAIAAAAVIDIAAETIWLSPHGWVW